jgi:hypothetical protein
MSTNIEPKMMFAAAAAITAAGFLTVPIPAAATPSFPLAPACERYVLTGDMAIQQDNDITVAVAWSDNRVGGRPSYAKPGTARTVGSASGGMSGRHIDFTIDWDQGPGAGLYNRYQGDLNDDLTASGTTTNSLGTTNSWHTDFKANCIKSNPEPAPPGQNPPGQNPPAEQPAQTPVTNAIALSFSPPGFGSITATVTNSSDLTAKCTYDASGLTKTHRDFTVGPRGSTNLTFNGFNTGTSYHVVVSCHDASGKQSQEIGHVEQDVTF